MELTYKPIGIIHSPFTSRDGMPIQPTSDASESGTLEIFPEFVKGLKDIEGFSHIYILYHFHKVRQPKLIVTPFLDKNPHGIFATRAPSCPNPIGLSLVKLISVENNLVFIDQIDVLNETPLLDIKLYIPDFENHQDVRVGWLESSKNQVRGQKSDNHFQ